MDADTREGTRRHRRPVPTGTTAVPSLPGDALSPHDATQLKLLDDQHLPDWRLDESTKAIGLHGVERARAALRTARRRQAALQEGAQDEVRGEDQAERRGELQSGVHRDHRDGRATAA